MPVSPARAAAYDILLKIEQEEAYASELLHAPRYAWLSAADHGLVTELVMGVLRWRSALDQQIRACSSQRLEKLDLEVLTALRLAAYQLGFLERVPARAAVHESVELMKRARMRSAVPFVNAVLRKLADQTSAAKPASPKDAGDAALKRCSTQMQTDADQGSAGAGVSDTSRADAAGLSERYAHPQWLVERWCKQFGMEAAESICQFNQSVPVTAIRLRDPSAEADLQHEGVALLAGSLLASARRIGSGDITRTRAFTSGRIAIQDEASHLVALLVGRGSNILDCCAAPGGKTAILAERNPEATILAVELHPHRARLLRKLVPAENVQVIAADMCQLPLNLRFDRALVDVPCSGTGTLARHPEIKWRLKLTDLDDLRSRQLAVLRAAMAHLAPGGRLVYSTCSLEREENSEVVEKALAAGESFRLVDCRQELERLRAEGELVWRDLASMVDGPFLRTIPGVHPCDGFFAAILEKI
jgi:16S rRNA (cytosine967-C5)-methyltransferase